MKIITFDSSTKALTVALAQTRDELTPVELSEASLEPGDFTIMAAVTTLGKRQHGETLAPAIHTILDQVDWKMSDVDAVVVGVGPGSYTGMRIGVTFAKVWANSAKLPLYSVSSLALVAASAPVQSDFVIPIMDARRQTAYTGLYAFEGETAVAVEPDQHIKFEVWLAKIKTHIKVGSRVTLVGTDIAEFVEMTEKQLNGVEINVIDGWESYPHAVHAFGKVKWTHVEEPTLLVPFYAHATVAEQEWAQRVEGVDTEPNPDDLIDFK